MFKLLIGEAVYDIEFDPNDEGIAPSVRDFHTWEPWQLDIYRLIIEPQWNCIDCGANVGINSIAMAHHASAGTVFAFEPVKRTHELLQRNLARNKLGNVIGHRLGVGSAGGTVEIWTSLRELGNASIFPATSGFSDAESSSGTCHVEQITIVTLDEWWAEQGRPPIDFVKIDIEGSERNCLIGASSLIDANPGLVMICECGLHCQLRKEDIARGFVGPFELFSTLRGKFDLLLLVTRDGALHQMDSYAELRICMLNGHPVDDLLCCSVLPAALAHKWSPLWNIPTRLTSQSQVLHDGSLIYLNRHDDGWAMPSAGLDGTRGGAVITMLKPGRICIEIGEIYLKHADGQGYDVTVAVGNELRTIRVDDQRATLEFELAVGVHHVFVETLYALKADSYLGNPADTRKIGARFVIALSWPDDDQPETATAETRNTQ